MVCTIKNILKNPDHKCLGNDMTLKQCVCACVDEKPRDAFVRVKKGELRVQKMEHLNGSWGVNWPVQKRRV